MISASVKVTGRPRVNDNRRMRVTAFLYASNSFNFEHRIMLLYLTEIQLSKFIRALVPTSVPKTVAVANAFGRATKITIIITSIHNIIIRLSVESIDTFSTFFNQVIGFKPQVLYFLCDLH